MAMESVESDYLLIAMESVESLKESETAAVTVNLCKNQMPAVMRYIYPWVTTIRLCE